MAKDYVHYKIFNVVTDKTKSSETVLFWKKVYSLKYNLSDLKLHSLEARLQEMHAFNACPALHPYKFTFICKYLITHL